MLPDEMHTPFARSSGTATPWRAERNASFEESASNSPLAPAAICALNGAVRRTFSLVAAWRPGEPTRRADYCGRALTTMRRAARASPQARAELAVLANIETAYTSRLAWSLRFAEASRPHARPRDLGVRARGRSSRGREVVGGDSQTGCGRRGRRGAAAQRRASKVSPREASRSRSAALDTRPSAGPRHDD